MTNQEIASVFRTIADRLELEGANPYRIRAYRKAAMNLEHLKDSISSIAERGRLKQIPGIGKDLEQKILDLLSTGTIREPVTDRPETETPDKAPFQLPGLDPKLATLLYKRFHIETLDDLERLARSHLLRTLPGLGVQLEHAIRDGFETLKKH